MKPIFTLLGTVVFSLAVNAQNTFPKSGAVGIGTSAPESSSLLEIRSTSKGFLCPRMTQSQRNAISPVTIGLLIYQTDNTPGFYYYSESGWKAVTTPAGANTALSNLAATTSVSASLLPSAANARDLGSADLAWRNLFVEGVGYLGAAKLGNYTGPAQAGMIRWTGTDFQGFNGTSWTSLTPTTYTAGSGISITGTTITNTAATQWATSGNSISYNSGQVGIGTATPQNKLDVKGGMAIGSNYGGNFTAPASGAIVEGNMGLGTPFPQNKLDVKGGVAIGNNFGGNFTAPAAGAIVEGQVGIGTASPLNKLDVKGGIAIGTHYAGNLASPADGALIQGKVGIGTANPAQQLEVNGVTKTTGLQITGGAATGYVLQSDAQGNASWVSPSVFGGSGSGGTGGWTVSGSGLYASVPGGVGIGTGSPTNKLDVSGGVAIGTSFAGSATAAPANGLVVEGSIGVGTLRPVNKLDVGGGLAVGSNYAGVTTAPADGMVVQGKVGIGTNTPTNLLDVEGGVAIGSSFSGTQVAPADGLVVEGNVGVGTSTPLNKLDVEGGMAIGSAYSGTKVAPVDGVVVEGRVGIGTAVPTNKLDISGSVAVGTTFSANAVAAPADGLVVEGKIGVGTLAPVNKLDIGGGAVIGSSYSGTKVAPANGILVEGNIGVGTDAPVNKLDVKGGIAIGSDYAGVVSAPTNGAVIEGKLGVGTSTPTNLLDVKGGAAIGSTFAAGFTAAPADGLVVEGSIGLGTLTPRNKLDVEGGMAIGSAYSGTKVSPADGVIIQGKVGIGTDAPGSNLEVNGATKTSSLQITNGAVSGYVLQSDAQGNATWVDPSVLGGSSALVQQQQAVATGTQQAKVDDLAAANAELKGVVATLQNENARQQQSINEMKSQLSLVLQRLSALQAAQEACCEKENNKENKNGPTSGVSSTSIELSGDAPILEQNIPNPFGRNTVIRYYLPAGVTSAAIVITDASGVALKTVALGQRGNGVLNLAAGSFSAGTYFYSLLVNGKVVASRKMVLTGN
ncbi:hypothetical protein V9K67_05950 [Paraflavisolibacter sp. H34]|uniref:beta strand repeat-containing protein n=1 Tax=Huijunlia imazamoxiresistens TaxID=3127457 RepID=UPI003019281F